jgi:hypothetical protein
MTSDFVQPAPRADLLWLAVDLDGTLAEPVWTPANPTSEIGPPIAANVEKLRAAVAAGYKPVIHTSRPSTDYEAIEAWLRHHEIPFSRIQTGKILAALYIDDRARTADAESWIPGRVPAAERFEAQYLFWAREAFRLARRSGWAPFGTHAASGSLSGPLEFDGDGGDGLPLWERPCVA